MLAAAPDSAPATPAGPQWVVLTCDDVRLAVPLARVREILTPRPFTRLPGCGPDVCGLIAVRGRVVTVFDLSVVLARRPAATVPDHRLLLVDHRGRAVGFAVDAVVTIAPAEIRHVTEPPLPIAEDVIGIGDIDHQRFAALDLDHLLGRLLH